MAFQSPANFSSLPRELQQQIFRTYLGDSYANYAYLNAVFAGVQDMQVFIHESFSPKKRTIYLNPGVSERLNLSRTPRGYKRRSVGVIADASIHGSGLMREIFKMVGNHTDWLEGELILQPTHPHLVGWMKVVEYVPGTTVWEFNTADYDEWMEDYLTRN